MCLLSEQHIFMYLFCRHPKHSLELAFCLLFALAAFRNFSSIPAKNRNRSKFIQCKNVFIFLICSYYPIYSCASRLYGHFFPGPGSDLDLPPRARRKFICYTFAASLSCFSFSHIFFCFQLLFFIFGLRADFPVFSAERYYARVRLRNKSALT